MRDFNYQRRQQVFKVMMMVVMVVAVLFAIWSAGLLIYRSAIQMSTIQTPAQLVDDKSKKQWEELQGAIRQLVDEQTVKIQQEKFIDLYRQNMTASSGVSSPDINGAP